MIRHRIKGTTWSEKRDFEPVEWMRTIISSDCVQIKIFMNLCFAFGEIDIEWMRWDGAEDGFA